MLGTLGGGQGQRGILPPPGGATGGGGAKDVSAVDREGVPLVSGGRALPRLEATELGEGGREEEGEGGKEEGRQVFIAGQHRDAVLPLCCPNY